jgi:hypothetical protein
MISALFLLAMVAQTSPETQATPQSMPPAEQTQVSTPTKPAKPLTMAQQANTPEQKKMAKDDPNRIVCRKEPQIGSLVRGKKICKTQADWKALAQESKDYSNQQQQKSGEIRNGG